MPGTFRYLRQIEAYTRNRFNTTGGQNYDVFDTFLIFPIFCNASFLHYTE